MKCYRSLCILFISLFLAGCNAKSNTTPILTNLQFTAQIDYYNERYSCFTEIDSQGDMTVRVISPETIEDMLLTFTKNGITAQYKDITYTPKIESMPIGNLSQIVYDVFQDVSQNVKSIPIEGDNCKIDRKTDENKYIFTFSPSGLPLNLKIPKLGFEMVFENIKIIKS